MPTADDALTEERIAELARCYQEPAYFIHHYCMIYDAVAGAWVPFRLWDAQADALAQVHEHQLSIILKARQIGMTWLMLSYALWLMRFRPIASILVFSRRDTGAAYLISFDRMRGIYGRLPAWMVAGHTQPEHYLWLRVPEEIRALEHARRRLDGGSVQRDNAVARLVLAPSNVHEPLDEIHIAAPKVLHLDGPHRRVGGDDGCAIHVLPLCV